MKMDWIKGKSLAMIKKEFHKSWWDTVWIPEENLLIVTYTGAGIAIHVLHVIFSEKLRAKEVIWKRKNGYSID